MTGLQNMYSFISDLRSFEPQSFLVLMDLDGLGELNRERGYAQGDAVIIGSSRLLADLSLLHGYRAYRYRNGDEFVLVFEAKGARVDQVLRSMQAIRGQLLDEVDTAIDFSFGCVMSPNDSLDEGFLADLERCLVAAKTNGTFGCFIDPESGMLGHIDK